jgi:MFS family permease
MVGVAVGWQIYDITKSAFDLGLVGLAQFFPLVLFLLVVGHVVDRYDRRVIACISESIGAAAAALLAFATVTHTTSLVLIYLGVFIVGTSRAFELPSTQSLLPALVPLSEMGRATARMTTAHKAAVVVGPAVGGLLYAFGPLVVYAVAGALYTVAAVLLISLHTQGAPRALQPATIRSLFAGIGFIRRTPVILGSISLDLFAVLLGGATALLPIYARDILSVGPVGLGLLRSAPAAGALITSYYLSRFPLRHRAGWTMFAAVAAFGVATIVFGISRSFVLSFFALVILGAADVVSVVIRSTLVQIRTPDAMRGRVNSVNSLFTGTSNQLGEFESGVTAAWFGTVPAVVIGGLGTIVIMALWIVLFPAIAKIDSLDADPPGEERRTVSA